MCIIEFILVESLLPVTFVTRSSKYIAILGFGIGLCRIHIGEKLFDCHECDKKFESAS